MRAVIVWRVITSSESDKGVVSSINEVNILCDRLVQIANGCFLQEEKVYVMSL